MNSRDSKAVLKQAPFLSEIDSLKIFFFSWDSLGIAIIQEPIEWFRIVEKEN